MFRNCLGDFVKVRQWRGHDGSCPGGHDVKYIVESEEMGQMVTAQNHVLSTHHPQGAAQEENQP